MKRKILGILLSVALVFGSVDVTALAAEAAVEEDVIQDEEAVTEETAEIIETSDEKKEDNSESEEEQVSEEQQTVTEEAGEKYSAEATEETQTAAVEVSEQESEETETVSSEEEATEVTTVENDNTEIQSGNCGINATWSYDTATKTLTISGTGGIYTSSIDSSWEQIVKEAEKLVIEEGITTIGSYIFKDFSGLTGKLTIPNSVTTISSRAFESCKGLTELVIGNSVTRIEQYAFKDCSGLTGKLTIPNSVTTIGYGAFESCKGLTKLVIGNSVTGIGSNAFQNCSELKGDLTIPNSVTTIGESAFSSCGFDGNLTIGNSVTTIWKAAFSGCSGLKGDLTIPDSVTTIKEYAFYHCNGLDGNLTIGNGVTEIGESAFYECKGLTGLTIGNKVETIGEKAFYECKELKGDLIIPDSVTEIGESAFWNCSGFNGNLVIGNGVTTIAYNAFRGCTFGGSLTLGTGITTIEADTFYKCSGLSGDLIIPDNVTKIGGFAFEGCSGFDGKLTIGNGVTGIGRYAFYNCSGLKGDLIIPDSVTEVGYMAFEGCSGFDGELKIGSNVTEIGAFSGCSGLRGNIVIPDSVTKIYSSAFEGCSGFDGELKIGSNVTEIDSSAFKDCSGLRGNIVIPDSVTKIEHSAFEGCSGLTGDLTIPKSVTVIGEDVFKGCANLGDAYITSFDTEIGGTYSNEDIFQFKEGTKTKIYAPIYSSAWEYATKYEEYYEYGDWGEHGIKEVTADFAGWEVNLNVGSYQGASGDWYIYAYDEDDNYITRTSYKKVSMESLKWDELPAEAAFVRVVVQKENTYYEEKDIYATSDRIERENYPEISFQLNELYPLSGSLMLDMTMLGELISLGDNSTTKSQSFRFELSYGEQEDKDSWTNSVSSYEHFYNNNNSGTVQITGLEGNKTYYGELRVYAGDSKFPSFETIFNLPKFTTSADESVNMADAFPDAVFRSLVQKALPYNVTDKNYVARSDLEKITNISDYIRSFGAETIQSIEGIEYLAGLRYISLTSHEISDADKADWSKLKALQQLNLKGNETENAPDLSENKKLTSVNFEENCMSVSEIEKLLKTIPKGASVNASPYTQRLEGFTLITEPVYYDDEIIVRVRGYKTDLPYTLQFYLDGQRFDFTQTWTGSGLWSAQDSKLAVGEHTVKVELLKQGSIEDIRQKTFEIKNEDYYTKQDKIYFSSDKQYYSYVIDGLYFSRKITANVTGIDMIDNKGTVVASSQYENAYAYSSWITEQRYTTILEDGSSIRKDINYAYGGLKTEDGSSIPAGEYDVVLKFSDNTQHIYEKLVIVTGDDIPFINKLGTMSPYDNSGDYVYLMLYTASVDPEKLAYTFKLWGSELQTKYIGCKEVYDGVIVKLQKVDWIDINRMNYRNVEVSVKGKNGYTIKGGSPQTVQVYGHHYVAYNELTGKMEITFSADSYKDYPVGKKVVIPLRKLQNGTYVDTEITGTAVVQEGITKFDLVDAEGNPATLEADSSYNPSLQGSWNGFTVKSTEDRIRDRISIKGAKDYPITVKVYQPNDAQYIVKRTINDANSIEGDYYIFTQAFVESLEQNGIYQVVVSDGKNRYMRSSEWILRVGDETTDDSNMLDIRPEPANPNPDNPDNPKPDPDDPDHQHVYAQEWSNNNEKHWHECSCGAKTDEAAHEKSDWITDKEATAAEAGKRHTECTICKKVLQEEEIPSGGMPNPDKEIKISDIPVQQYTGSELTPAVTVTAGETILREGIDYRITYINTTNAYLAGHTAYEGKASPKAKITMLGEYSGIYTKNFNITPVNLKDESAVCITAASVVETNKAQKITPYVYFNGMKMEAGKDYTLSYPSGGNYTGAGLWDVTVSAVPGGNFVDERTVSYEIIGKSDAGKYLMSRASISLSPQKFTYTGAACEPAVAVYYGGRALKQSQDYEMLYYHNINAGIATVVITGKDKYVGTQETKYKIVKASVKNAEITGVPAGSVIYSGKAVTFDNITVKCDGRELVKGRDYTVSYKNNFKAGNATMVVTGKGNYTGSKSVKFKISAAELKESYASTKGKAQYSPKGAVLSDLKITLNGNVLTEGRDYKVSYKNNKKVTAGENTAEATIKGVNGCWGSFTLKYEIEPADFSDVTIVTSDAVYTDKAGNYKTKIKVYDASGKQLAEKKQYIIESYSKADGKPVDDAYKAAIGEQITIKITPKEGDKNYKEGTSTVCTYKIVKGLMDKAKVSALTTKSLSKDDVTELSEKDFSGKVMIGKDTLRYDIDFEIAEGSFTDTDKPGNATVTLIGKGEYGGTKIVKYKITK